MIRVRTYYKGGRNFFGITLYHDEVILDNDKDLSDFVSRKHVYDIYDNDVALLDNEIVTGIDRNFNMFGYLYNDLKQTEVSAIDNMVTGKLFNHNHTNFEDFNIDDIFDFEEEDC